MVRFSEVAMVYFIIAAVMWGSGLIAWEDTGFAGYIVDNPEDGASFGPDAVDDLNSTGGGVEATVSQAVAPIGVIWNLLTNIISFIAWPITVLAAAGAPPSAVVLLGGAPTTAFFMGLANVIIRSN